VRHPPHTRLKSSTVVWALPIPLGLDDARGIGAASERWCRTSLSTSRQDGSQNGTVAAGQSHDNAHQQDMLDGQVVDPFPKRPDVAERRTPCRAPVCLEEPGLEGYISTISCPGSLSVPRSSRFRITSSSMLVYRMTPTPLTRPGGTRRMVASRCLPYWRRRYRECGARRRQPQDGHRMNHTSMTHALMMLGTIDRRSSTTSCAPVGVIGLSPWWSLISNGRWCG
jgi:hypothetical protein